MPALDEMVWAARGEGCWWNGRRAAVSAVTELGQACICYTSWPSFAEQGRQQEWQKLVTSTRLRRGWGDCYGHILVATGRAEASFDPHYESVGLRAIAADSAGSRRDLYRLAGSADDIRQRRLLFQRPSL